MAARIKLYADWYNKRLVLGKQNSGLFTFPPLFQGDLVPFAVYILSPNPDAGPSAYTQEDISGMALKMAVTEAPTGTVGGPSPIATQYTWNKDVSDGAGFFWANLPLNQPGVASLIGSAASATAYLELEITEDASVTTVWQGQVTIKAECIESTSESVAAGLTPLDLETALQMFAKKFMNAGETMTIPSPNGLHRRIIGCNDDGSAQDDLL